MIEMTYQIVFEYDFSSEEEFLLILAGDIMSRYGISIEDLRKDFNTNYGREIHLYHQDGTHYTIVIDTIHLDEDEIFVDYYVSCAHPDHETIVMVELED